LHTAELIKRKTKMKNPFELCKKLLVTLMLVGMMTAFVTGCSSSDDPVSDDAASAGGSSGDEGINQMCQDTTESMDDYEKCLMENLP
jgi:hypothetical protein